MATAELETPLETEPETTQLPAGQSEDEHGNQILDWGSLDVGQRDSYLATLREKIEKENPPAEKPERQRDPSTGRYTNESSETSASGDETPVAGDAGQKQADDQTSTDWRDADVKDLAAAFGISEDRLAKIPNREVLDVLLDSIDEKGVADRKAAAAPAGDQQQQAPQAKGKGQQATDDALAKLEAFDLGGELGSEDAPKIMDAFKAVTAELKELRSWRGQQQQAQVQQQVERLRSYALDSLHKLGHSELYGEPGKAPTAAQKANIEAVMQDHFERGALLEQRGGNPRPTPELLKRSVFALHGEQIVNHEKQQQLGKLRKQASRVTGGGSTKSNGNTGMSPLEQNLRNLPTLRRELDIPTE